MKYYQINKLNMTETLEELAEIIVDKNSDYISTCKEVLAILLVMQSISKNIEFYKTFVKKENQYSFSSDCHGNLYALLSALLSSGVVDLDQFEKNAKILSEIDLNFTAVGNVITGLSDEIGNVIIFVDRTATTDQPTTITFAEFKSKLEIAIFMEDYSEVAKYIPIPNIPLTKEKLARYINAGDNPDRDLLSNVCYIFAQYLSSQGLFFIDGNHEKMYKINDAECIRINGGILPSPEDEYSPKNKKFVEDYTGTKNFGEFCHFIQHSSGRNFLISHTFISPTILKTLLNKTCKCGAINKEQKEEYLKAFFLDYPKNTLINFPHLNENYKKLETLIKQAFKNGKITEKL